jgi:hypothetical protein
VIDVVCVARVDLLHRVDKSWSPSTKRAEAVCL